MQKLTKIRKWAADNGYNVHDCKLWVTVEVSPELSFNVDERESTIYTSIRGKRGNPAGVYMSVRRPKRRETSFQYSSQKAIIEAMESEIKKAEGGGQ